MTADTILYEEKAGWVKLTLNRPDKLNSFNEEMHRALQAALTRAEQARARALLLTGAGNGFCAGQDLSDRSTKPGSTPPDLGYTVDHFWNPLIRRLTGFPAPVVCAVNGAAAGAGSSIALACDIVLAAKSAKFIQSFAKVGLIPDSGGSWHLPRLVGQARAMGLALLGETLTGEQAAEWGLIWKAYKPGELMMEAEALAAHLASQPTEGLTLIKRAIRASFSNPLNEHLQLERDSMQAAGRTRDYREGVTAFMEKRSPKFEGR